MVLHAEKLSKSLVEYSNRVSTSWRKQEEVQKKNQRKFIKKSIQSYSRRECLFNRFSKPERKFIPRFIPFNHSIHTRSCQTFAFCYAINEKSARKKRRKTESETVPRRMALKTSFVRLLNSLTHDIANLQHSRKRLLLDSNAIGVTTCRGTHKNNDTQWRQWQKKVAGACKASKWKKNIAAKELNKIKGGPKKEQSTRFNSTVALVF